MSSVSKGYVRHAASRTVYGRTFETTRVSLWLLQRGAGILLGPVVALHIWAPDMAQNRALNAIILALVIAHAYGGVRRFALAEGKARRYAAFAVAWCVAVAAFATLVILAGR